MLSVVSTPIGNLGDITLRAVEALRECDAIVCEDTRVTGKLLSLLNLPKKRLIAFHAHAHPRVLEEVMTRLKSDEHLCLVSDAGTPGISDPGFAVVSRAREENIAVEVLPGASAFLAALSGSGVPIHRFLYLGFLPVKKGRRTLLDSLRDEEHTVVFYESPHRIEKTLAELHELFRDDPDRLIVLARELTKVHEEFLRVRAEDLPEAVKTLTVKGEFVVMIAPRGRGR